MKRLLSLILVSLLGFSLIGCGSTDTDDKSEQVDCILPDFSDDTDESSMKIVDILEKQVFNINGVEIALGKTTLGDIRDSVSFEEPDVNLSSVIELSIDSIGDYTFPDMHYMNIDIISPSTTEVVKDIDSYIVSSIRFTKDSNLDVSLNGVSLNNIKKSEDLYNVFTTTYFAYEDGLYFDVNLDETSKDLTIECDNLDSPVIAVINGKTRGIDLARYDFTFKDGDEEFTSNYLNELKVNGEIFTLQNMKVKDFIAKDYIFFVGDDYTEHVLGVNATTKACLYVVSRVDGIVTDIEIEVMNLTDEEATIDECTVTEFKLYSPASILQERDPDVELYGGIFSDFERSYSREEFESVYGTPDVDLSDDDTEFYAVEYSVDNTGVGLEDSYIEYTRDSNFLHVFYDFDGGDYPKVTLITWFYNNFD